MHADLMRASGMELDFDERGWAEFLEDGPIGAGGACVCGFGGGARGHLYAAIGIARDGEFDAALCAREFSLHEREIGLLHGARLKGFREFGVSEIVFGDDYRAARVFVQPMNDAGPQRVTALRKRLAAAEKRVDERAARVPCSGVNGHTGGLVDDDEVVVFVEDVERDGFSFSFERCAWFRLNGDALAATEFLARLGRLAIDENEAGIDEFLDAGAGKFGTMRGDKAVEARAGIGGRGEEFDLVGGHAAIVAA